jgi:hypothetical protein
MARVKRVPRNRFSGIFRTTSPGEISFFGENPALTQLRRARNKRSPNPRMDAALESVLARTGKPEVITSPEQQPGFANFKKPQQSKRTISTKTRVNIGNPYNKYPLDSYEPRIATPKMLADTKPRASAKVSDDKEMLMERYGTTEPYKIALQEYKWDKDAQSKGKLPPTWGWAEPSSRTRAKAVDTGMSYDVPTASSAGSVQRTRPPRKAHEYREAMVGALNSGNKSEANRLYGEAVERALKRGDKDEAELIKNTYWGTVRGEPIAPRQDVKNLRETFDDAYNFAQRNRGDASAQAEVNRLRGLLAEEKLRQWKRNNRAIDTGMSYNVKNLDESVADAVAQRNRGVAGAQDEVNRLRPYLFQEYIDRATRRADVENEPGMSISALSPQEQRAVRRKMVNALGSNEYSSIPEYTRVSNAKKRMTKRSIKKADYFVNNAPSRLSPGELGDMRRKNFLAGKSPINDVNIFGWENSQKKDADKWAQYIDRLSLIDFKPFYFAQNTSPFDSVYGNSMRQEPASMLTSNKKMYQSAYGPLKPGSTRGSTAMKRLSKRQAGPKPDKYF